MSAMPVSAGSGVVPVISRQLQSRQGPDLLKISDVIIPLLQFSPDDLPLTTTSLLLETSVDSLLSWVRVQRLMILPHEASKYDNEMKWIAAFVERLGASEEIIVPFTPDIHLATRLACGYCAMLLELNGDGGSWLEEPSGFFYDISTPFENLLRAARVDNSEEIAEQLTMALVNLVALIAAVSIHLYKSSTTSLGSHFINFYEQFAGQIETLRSRYMSVTMAISMHRLQGQTRDIVRGNNLYAIPSWLAPDDPVVAELNEAASRLTRERSQSTADWIHPWINGIRRSQKTHFHLAGQPGSGKSVLAQVIIDYLHSFRDATDYLTLSVSISTRLPAERTVHSIARAILYQMLTRSCGNVPFLIALSESFEHSRRLADDDGYDNLLWDTLKRGLIGLAPEFNQIFLVVNGVDEALCDQQTLLMKLVSILSEVPNMKLITLGMHKPMAADGQSFMELTAERIWEDISTIISASFEDKQTWLELSEVDQEVIVEQLTDASKGSFLWAKLASGLVCAQESLDQLREAVDSLITTKPSVTGLVLLTLNQENVSIEAKHMLLLLAIAQRPLRPAELSILASILIDEQIVPVGDMEFKASIYQSLSSLSDLVSFSGNLISLRHGMIKDSVLEVLSHSKLDSDEDPDTDFLTRLFVYLNCSVENDSNPAFNPLDQHTAATLQNENPLLQYAVRYWPVHFQNLPVSQQNSTIGRLEKITNCLPMSTTFIRLLSTVWDGLPKPQCLSYHEITTDLYRKSVGDDNVVTLQCVILLASQYRQVGSVEKAITLYYEAAMYSRKAFTERLLLTSQLVNAFLDLTTDQITSSLTEIMRQRHEVLLLLVECHKLQYGDTSEELIATMRLLAEHHQTVGEKQEAQEVLASIKHSC